MNSLAGQYVFTRENKGSEIAKEVKSCGEGIALGIKFEEDSITFYEGIKKIVPPASEKIIEKLIEEEKKHLKTLTDLKEGGKV